jgi:hypothetical protein
VGSTLPLRIISYNIPRDSPSTKRAPLVASTLQFVFSFCTALARSKDSYTTLQANHLAVMDVRGQD